MPDPKRPPADRAPGRSFEDPSRPLGEELVERAEPISSQPEGGIYGRAAEYGPRPVSVADRAKAVGVLRKAEEFMRTHNPDPSTPPGMHRAIELAAGRSGLSLAEYEAIVRHDPELAELERRVLEDALRRG